MKEQQLILPALGMSQDSGLIVEWLKRVGDWVEQDDAVLAVETDKTTMELPSPWSGRLMRILAQVDEDVPVGSPVAVVVVPATDDEKAQLLALDLDSEAGDVRDSPPGTPSVPAPPSESELELIPSAEAAPLAVLTGNEGKILASPKAKALAQRHRINLKELLDRPQFQQPFRAEDVEQYIGSRPSHAESTAVTHSQGKRSAVPWPDVLRLEVGLEMERFHQLLQWLSEQGEWRALHLWLRINQLVFSKSPFALSDDMLAMELSQGKVTTFRATVAAGSGLPSLTEVDAAKEHQPLLLGCIDDDTVLDCTLTAADWQFVLYMGRPGRALIQAPRQQATLQALLDYRQKLAEVMADPLPYLI